MKNNKMYYPTTVSKRLVDDILKEVGQEKDYRAKLASLNVAFKCVVRNIANRNGVLLG